MDDKETVKQDEAQLDHLEEEIDVARHHLDEMTHVEEHEPYLFEDDQDPPAAGNENVPA